MPDRYPRSRPRSASDPSSDAECFACQDAENRRKKGVSLARYALFFGLLGADAARNGLDRREGERLHRMRPNAALSHHSSPDWWFHRATGLPLRLRFDRNPGSQGSCLLRAENLRPICDDWSARSGWKRIVEVNGPESGRSDHVRAGNGMK